MNSQNIGRNLTELRKISGFTQAEVAAKLKVTPQAISKWERGENLPDSLLLLEVAEIYDTTVDNILKGILFNDKKEVEIVDRDKKTIRGIESWEEDSDWGIGYQSKYSGGVMVIATAIYLILGLVYGLWHPGWIIFIFAAGVIQLLRK